MQARKTKTKLMTSKVMPSAPRKLGMRPARKIANKVTSRKLGFTPAKKIAMKKINVMPVTKRKSIVNKPRKVQLRTSRIK